MLRLMFSSFCLALQETFLSKKLGRPTFFAESTSSQALRLLEVNNRDTRANVTITGNNNQRGDFKEIVLCTTSILLLLEVIEIFYESVRKTSEKDSFFIQIVRQPKVNSFLEFFTATIL